MNTTRRRFLQTTSCVASACLTDGMGLSGLSAFGAEPPPEKLRFGPGLEPIVRLISFGVSLQHLSNSRARAGC